MHAAVVVMYFGGSWLAWNRREFFSRLLYEQICWLVSRDARRHFEGGPSAGEFKQDPCKLPSKRSCIAAMRQGQPSPCHRLQSRHGGIGPLPASTLGHVLLFSTEKHRCRPVWPFGSLERSHWPTRPPGPWPSR